MKEFDIDADSHGYCHQCQKNRNEDVESVCNDSRNYGSWLALRADGRGGKQDFPENG